jgi:hypothetical protein
MSEKHFDEFLQLENEWKEDEFYDMKNFSYQRRQMEEESFICEDEENPYYLD